MSEYGAALQTYTQELVECIEDLKRRKRGIQSRINKEEIQKQALEKEVEALNEKLKDVNANLHKHRTLHNDYELKIQQTESSFKKILDTCQVLLNLMKEESTKLRNSTTSAENFEFAQQNSFAGDQD